MRKYDNICFKVNSVQESVTAQETLFAAGYKWLHKGTQLTHVDKPYLFVGRNGNILCTEAYSVYRNMKKSYNEVDVNYVIGEPQTFNRITTTQDLKRGNIVFMLCCGSIRKVVITSDPYEKDAGDAVNYSWRRDYTTIEGSMCGWTNSCFEGDYGIGKADIPLNGLFDTYEDAFKYSISEGYKTRLAEHKRVCEDMFESFDRINYHRHFPIYSSRDWRFKVSTT